MTEGSAAPRGARRLVGTGRRKSAVARVQLRPGDGSVTVNDRALVDYFKTDLERLMVIEPLLATSTEKQFEVRVRVNGGGRSGQAGAVRMGVARALLRADERHEGVLRDRGFLTRDARIVERKKYGRRKARRRFQFSKR